MAKPHRVLKKANHGRRPANSKARRLKRKDLPHLSAAPATRFFLARASASDFGNKPGSVGDQAAGPSVLRTPISVLPRVSSFSKRAIGVPGKDLLIDLSAIDLNHVVADIETIRRYNPQRFEMEQLSAIIYEDPVERDLRRVQGHHGPRILGSRPLSRLWR